LPLQYNVHWIFVSSLSDAYQPIERKFKLTRRVFDAISYNNRLRILTKSDLIVRDSDVLSKFKGVEIGLTVNSFDERLRRELEPRAVSMERRLNALRTLKDEGFRTFGFVSPEIPYLTDVEAVLGCFEDNVIALSCDNSFIKDEPGRLKWSAYEGGAKLPWNNPHWHPAHGGIYRNVFLYDTGRTRYMNDLSIKIIGGVDINRFMNFHIEFEEGRIFTGDAHSY